MSNEHRKLLQLAFETIKCILAMAIILGGIIALIYMAFMAGRKVGPSKFHKELIMQQSGE